MRRIMFSLVVCALSFYMASGQNPILEEYLKLGLESNKALKQRQLDYTKSVFALKEAKGMFFPDINLNARYTLADGGRLISFPVGDMLNPVYNTLNLLTSSNQFPAIENQEFPFYRAKEQETKLSLVQPIYSSDIIANVRIKREYSELAKVDIDLYKRELIKEIKTSYYTFQKAFSLQKMIDSTLLLVKENLRVSTALFNNDLLTIDAVYRSESEVSMLEVERARALAMYNSTKAYFNFLLNRSLDSEIELYLEEAQAIEFSLSDFQNVAVANREEMTLVKKAQSLNKQVLNMQKGAATPDVFAAVDYGFQGEEYSFTEDDDFVMASMVLRWNIFQGMTKRNKIQQTKIEGEKLNEILSETEMRIQLQVITDYYSTVAAFAAIDAAKKRLTSSKKAFRLIAKKYAEGQITLLEYIDARTNYTSAQSNLIIANNDYYIRIAQLEYAAANVDIKQY